MADPISAPPSHVRLFGNRDSAVHLAAHARSVTMLVRDKALAASHVAYLSERILSESNVEVRYEVEITGLSRQCPDTSRRLNARRRPAGVSQQLVRHGATR